MFDDETLDVVVFKKEHRNSLLFCVLQPAVDVLFDDEMSSKVSLTYTTIHFRSLIHSSSLGIRSHRNPL